VETKRKNIEKVVIKEMMGKYIVDVISTRYRAIMLTLKERMSK
tara:strand:+ start:1885 stop:2013 length:129 start_codon:yes stop_codon:yes gene_type:complete